MQMRLHIHTSTEWNAMSPLWCPCVQQVSRDIQVGKGFVCDELSRSRDGGAARHFGGPGDWPLATQITNVIKKNHSLFSFPCFLPLKNVKYVQPRESKFNFKHSFGRSGRTHRSPSYSLRPWSCIPPEQNGNIICIKFYAYLFVRTCWKLRVACSNLGECSHFLCVFLRLQTASVV